jgi:cytochrome c1
MKNKAKELDVDFIGGQNNPLTKEEQVAISAFIKQLKEKRSKIKKSKSLKTENQIA